jgi:putative membrane protein
MSNASWDRHAKDQVSDAIRAVEAQTSAEIVVAVRPKAGHYRHTDYLLGAIAALVALFVLLFADQEFAVVWMPLDTVFAFAAGATCSAFVPPVRRLFTLASLMRQNVRTAARATLVDLGVTKTRDRNGILVFVSAFEHAVEVVADVGVDTAALGPAWTDACAALSKSMKGRPRLDLFLTALKSLGPVLAAAMPRKADDVNELPDEVA